jgi:serine/threonine protein kinase
VPPALASIILKLLAKNPADRYQTAEAVLADLETVQHSGGEDRPLTRTSLLEAIARGQLVGRAQEIAVLRSSVETMLHGPGGGVVFIEGEPGIGKTRLVVEAGPLCALEGVSFTGHATTPT